MAKAWTVWLIGIFFLFVSGGCQPKENQNDTSKAKVLAQVFNKQLLDTDLEGILPEGYKPEDSTMIYNAYIENWLRDAVLMHEAEQKISQNIDIDKLVKDYRSTLILHNYEEVIVETQLDSTISQTELNQFYEENKDNYQLKESLARVWFMKIPINANEIGQLDLWWQSEDIDDQLNLIEYCDTYAEIYHLDKEKWYEIAKIKRHIPTKLTPLGTFTQKGADITASDERYKYYLRVFELIQKNEAPPKEYIEEKARQVILQKRKSLLLKEHKENLYEKEINNVKVFTQ